MQKIRKKPAIPASVPTAAKSGGKPALARGKANPRLQADNRWQRTKRYGWDSR